MMGTAITPDQLKILAGYAEEIVLALDADRAGREAMLRAPHSASPARAGYGCSSRPCRRGEDPADLMLTDEGAARMREALAALWTSPSSTPARSSPMPI